MEISNSNLKQYQKIETTKSEVSSPEKEQQSDKLKVLESDTVTLSSTAQELSSDDTINIGGGGGGQEPSKVNVAIGGGGDGQEPPSLNGSGSGGGIEPPSPNGSGSGGGIEPPKDSSN
jgi:hypothetical protein